jgi:Lon protease-like protein
VAELPMFPLGTVLLPGAVLPLHVFEPRYRALVQVCVAGDGEFGVVLIERGSEVGGGDTRTSAGCVARIAEVRELPDGRYVLVAVGTRRIAIEQWLPDDPYPRADVREWPDADDEADQPDAPPLDAVLARLRRVLALRAELGEAAAPATTAVSDDPVLATYQASILTPCGPADHHRLLSAAGPAARRRLLDELLGEQEELLAFQLGQAGESPE